MDRPVILEQLEQGTRDLHARIERQVPLLDPALQIDTYRAFLESMLGFYQPFEDALAVFPWHRAGLDLDQRRKARLLIDDLQRLGHDHGSLASIRRCRDLPCPADLLEAMGCLYVVEGATLGGRILMRSVHRTLRLSPVSGCAFLASYGNAVGCMWRRFGEALVRAERTSTEAGTAAAPSMVTAARDTFAKLDRWLAGASSSSRARPPS